MLDDGFDLDSRDARSANAGCSQEEAAREIAIRAHAGQIDKAGRPYIEHPAHVASSVEGELAKAVAWLHDVVEDTAMTFDDIASMGVDVEVIEAVRALTREEGESYFAYIARVGLNPLAREVKLADLEHNSDLARLPVVTDADLARVERYRQAKAMLAR